MLNDTEIVEALEARTWSAGGNDKMFLILCNGHGERLVRVGLFRLKGGAAFVLGQTC